VILKVGEFPGIPSPAPYILDIISTKVTTRVIHFDYLYYFQNAVLLAALSSAYSLENPHLLGL
jgi:hypothetical protein